MDRYLPPHSLEGKRIRDVGPWVCNMLLCQLFRHACQSRDGPGFPEAYKKWQKADCQRSGCWDGFLRELGQLKESELKFACLQEALRHCHGVHWSEEPNLPLLPLDVDPAPARSLNPCRGRLLALLRAGPATKGALWSCDALNT